MNIQGFQKLTLLDYPGKVACTVFTGGCNLRCPFCHNAGLVNTPDAYTNAESDVLEYLSRRKGLLDGVCITGGEPLLQNGLADFAGKVKEMGYLLKLDTNGTLPERLREILKTGLFDYVAMDVKSSPAGYRTAIGVDTDFSLFEESMEILKSSGIDHEFRTTAVKGIHTAADIAEAARLVGDGEKYFIQRFVDSGNLIGTGCSSFSEEESLELLAAAREFVPGAELRGIDTDDTDG